MNWIKKLFYKEPESTKDLHAELKALCDRLVILPDYSGIMRYQEIRQELYKRGEQPCGTLTSIEEKLK